MALPYLVEAHQPQSILLHKGIAVLQVVYRGFVNLHGRLLLMVQWSLLAYTGICKILKKHHKRTGLLVTSPQLQNLLAQPFCSIEV